MRTYTMRRRKKFVSPRVMETCGVELEYNLLGASHEVMATPSVVETTGQKVNESTDAHDWQAGSWLD